MDIRLINFMVPADYISYEVEGRVVTISAEVGGLASAAEVVINGYTADFEVVSDQLIRAALPQGIDAVSSVEVYTTAVFGGERQRAWFEFGDHPSFVEGTELLTQQLAMQLYKDPGSDVFNPEDGAGMMTALGTQLSSATEPMLIAEVGRIVDRAVTQLRRKQMEYRGKLKYGERLVTAEVVSVNYDQQASSVSVVMKVVTEAGTATFGMEL